MYLYCKLHVRSKIKLKITYLSEGEDTFLRPDHAALHHDKVIIHVTIVGEASL